MKVYLVLLSRAIDGYWWVNEYINVFKDQAKAREFAEKLNLEDKYPTDEEAEYYVEEALVE